MEKSVQNKGSAEYFEWLAEAGRPYVGDVVEPKTELDALVLTTITKFSNDNLPPAVDPYTGKPTKTQIAPAARTLAGSSRAPIEFGLDHMTHHFNMIEDDRLNVICVYHKKHALSEVIVEEFGLQLGLVARTTFKSNEEQPSKVHKTRHSDFSNAMLQSTQGIGFADFSRELTKRELPLLKDLLRNPLEAEAAIRKLVQISDSEARMAHANRQRHDADQREYQERIDSIRRAARWVIPKGSR